MVEPEIENADMEASSSSNPCIICKYNCYVKDPATEETFVLEGLKSIQTCNKWSTWRNMHCKFKVRY